MKHDTLNKLYTVANKEAGRHGLTKELIFEPIGLRLLDPPEQTPSAPANSHTFAETGGDDVRFSLVQLDGNSPDQFPVVMTVPQEGARVNTIVGKSLHDFLCLGSQIGFYSLEELACDLEKSIRWLENPQLWARERHPDPSDKFLLEDHKELLKLLSRELNLKPWSNPRQKLNELQETFRTVLQNN